MNGKRLGPHVLRPIGLPPVLLDEAGKGFLVELRLRSLQTLQKVLLVLQDFCVPVVLGLEARFVGLGLGVPALDPGPAELFGDDQQGVEPGVVLADCLAVDLLH